MKVTVVFPMAGEGQRFGSKFKPFLKIFDKTFIELAVQPFLKHKDKIKEFIFIVREDHSKQFKVKEKLNNVKEITPTNSAIETISTLNYPLENVIFCDCDHSLNVDDLFAEILKDKYDCIIPGWDINPDEVSKWSIACVDDNNMLLDIEEKKFPLIAGDCDSYGVIGCYYFRRLETPSKDFKYLSQLVKTFNTKLVPIKEAEFFGDPERLYNLYISKNANTIFCDLDGTLIKHENIPDYTKGIELLEGSKDKIDEWRKGNSFIVLTTSRDEQFRPEMELMLREAGIRYEYLIMGLPPGTRYLINDKKPYSDKEMAKSIEVKRNEGIKSINIGHSFASISELNGVTIKTIPKDSDEYQKLKLRNQYDSMVFIERFGITPKMYEFKDLSYSMQYLKDYKGLHEFPLGNRLVILDRLFEKLGEVYKERVNCFGWLETYLSSKIYSKEQQILKLGLTGISELIETIKSIDIEYFEPTSIGLYHGDLTYENIMVKDNDFRLIDFDNDNLPAPAEQDLGKLMQSLICHYEHWDDRMYVTDIELEYKKIIEFYGNLLGQNCDIVEDKGRFYCALHLIRMIPYQAKTSMRRAKIALKLSKKMINGTY